METLTNKERDQRDSEAFRALAGADPVSMEVERQAQRSFALQAGDSMGQWAFEAQMSQELTPEEAESIRTKTGKAAKELFVGAPAAMAGGVSDLTAMGVALGYNIHNMLKGESFAWPENFNDVPSTSDYWGDMVGVDTNSLAFIAGGLAIPDLNDLRKSSKLWGAVKALGNGKKSAVRSKMDAIFLKHEGLSRDEIWQKTGWWQAKDKKWRFAISDADAKINFDRLGNLSRFVRDIADWDVGTSRYISIRLDSLLDHPALYQAYPQVGGYMVSIKVNRVEDDAFKLARTAVGPMGSVDHAGKLITVHHGADVRGTLLHEAQHIIQQIEGFQGGANATALIEDIRSYKLANVMLDVGKNPDDYLGFDDIDLYSALFRVDPDLSEDSASLLVGQLKRIINNGEIDDELAMYYNGIASAKGKNTSRWISLAKVEGLPDDELATLANMRYWTDLGEAEARLVQALSRVPQDKLDKLSKDPHSLMSYLDVNTIRKLDPEGATGIRKMEFPVAESAAVISK